MKFPALKKHLIMSVLGLSIGLSTASMAVSQEVDDQLRVNLIEYERAIASGDTASAVTYARSLARYDFSEIPLSQLEVRALKAEFAQTLRDAGNIEDAITLLSLLIEAGCA